MTLSQDPETTIVKSSLKFSSALTCSPGHHLPSPTCGSIWARTCIKHKVMYLDVCHRGIGKVLFCLMVSLSHAFSFFGPLPSPPLARTNVPASFQQYLLPLSLCVCIFLKRDSLTLCTLVCKFYYPHPGLSCPLDLKFCCG